MKQLVFINALAAKKVSNNNKLKNFVLEQLKTNHIYDFSSTYPNQNINNIDEEFSRGITTQQLSVIKQSPQGHFINPFLLGLKQDYNLWIPHIVQDHDSEIAYLEVPYEQYQEASKNDGLQVDRETYDIHSLHIKTLVQALHDDARKFIIIH